MQLYCMHSENSKTKKGDLCAAKMTQLPRNQTALRAALYEGSRCECLLGLDVYCQAIDETQRRRTCLSEPGTSHWIHFGYKVRKGHTKERLTSHEDTWYNSVQQHWASWTKCICRFICPGSFPQCYQSLPAYLTIPLRQHRNLLCSQLKQRMLAKLPGFHLWSSPWDCKEPCASGIPVISKKSETSQDLLCQPFRCYAVKTSRKVGVFTRRHLLCHWGRPPTSQGTLTTYMGKYIECTPGKSLANKPSMIGAEAKSNVAS